MEALLFGTSAAHLYGVYQPAEPGSARSECIVLCSPFGQEAIRAHRSLRQLAADLSRLGYDVLRFDYRGTGDSAGDMREVSASDWLEDIVQAREELRDISGASRISLLGLRMASVLAAQVAKSSSARRLVLWDPVESGQAYLDEVLAAIEHAEEHDKTSNFVDPEGVIHFNGFSIPVAFQSSLAAMLYPSADELGDCEVLQVVSHEDESFARLQDRWSSLASFEYQHAPAPHDWNFVDHVGGVMFPQPVMQAIAAWFR